MSSYDRRMRNIQRWVDSIWPSVQIVQAKSGAPLKPDTNERRTSGDLLEDNRRLRQVSWVNLTSTALHLRTLQSNERGQLSRNRN